MTTCTHTTLAMCSGQMNQSESYVLQSRTERHGIGFALDSTTALKSYEDAAVSDDAT